MTCGPPPGSTKARTRVGRGIAAGKGKTAGRGTKGQKARAGASIPAWFEGGQTPLHMRVPKLRGFRSINRIDYQVVNIGRISAYAEAGRLGELLTPKSPYTVNPEILRAAGLITKERQPVKILGAGEVSVPLFVLADAFTAQRTHQGRGRGRLRPDDRAARGGGRRDHPGRAGTPEQGSRGEARCRADGGRGAQR